jgi:hypothetical protein
MEPKSHLGGMRGWFYKHQYGGSLKSYIYSIEVFPFFLHLLCASVIQCQIIVRRKSVSTSSTKRQHANVYISTHRLLISQYRSL